MVVAALAAACATVPARDGGPARPLLPPAAPAESAAPGVIDDDAAIAPRLAKARPLLEARLVGAHRRLGRGRPAVASAVLGELGPGGQQAFVAPLRRGRCYIAIAVASSDDQELDLALLDADGLDVSRDTGPGSAAAVEVCPTADATYRLVVRMYGGSSAYALQLYGS